VLFEQVNAIRNIVVLDMSGRVVKELKGVKDTKVTFENLRPGMHTIRVVNLSTGETASQKIMISE
jgi:hypothetical protein